MTVANDASLYGQGFVQMLCSNDPDQRQKAWSILYRQCYPQVKSMVLKNGGKSEAVADLFHDGLVALFRNLQENKFESRSSVSTYLYGICFRLYCKRYQKQSRKTLVELEFWQAQMLTVEYDPTVDILWDRVATVLMNELRPHCREMLVQFYFNKRSMKELAAQFNVSSEQAAKNKKMRCLQSLRDLIDESEINPEILE